jgi:hypothetical protein
VAEGDRTVYFIDPASGAILEAFRLAPTPRGRRLVDLQSAGQRLVAVYDDSPEPARLQPARPTPNR